ncbi:cephalosporin hydroxylase family protein [Aromatoleum bremense]|uniref:Rhamnosyl O-methyltransferase n=1 Tax=Aromatoleum bremense TaxID=76115 RepID=A0ABX1NXA4_9RHOO|nr:cephalosporin hydroxylase family protein [Aromatoleum bremense]NMG16175.1 rhamnosyl O-methyltransferase [Aromatoleum bremense]QTQ32614.1 Rhamnosyl O-methyltransferase/Cephalosporin hydroxylase family protein [Aromatoleum bremense]
MDTNHPGRLVAADDVAERFHRWYYDNGVWETVRFLGVPCLKSVMDLWNYQEILFELKPSLIVEFGTRHGGSALYFSMIGQGINPLLRVLTVDIEDHLLDPQVSRVPAIEFMKCSSTDSAVAARIAELRNSLPGPMFAILDSDHRQPHVLQEMLSLRNVMRSGDYLVVEDSNINGHPVLPGWGPGPFEAIVEYVRQFPDDYVRDEAREHKFGFTFAPAGFLRRA